MSYNLFSSLFRHKRYAQIVGRLLIAYGEIEYEVARCLTDVLGDHTGALRVMFRTRGETARIHIADAIMQPHFEALKIEEYNHFIEATLFCIAIRNQYAHCHWNKYGRKLVFTNWEIFALPRVKPDNLKLHPITLDLLEQQEAYFAYVQRGLWYLCSEYQKRTGKTPSLPYGVPKEVPRPLKCLDEDKLAHRIMMKSQQRARRGKRRAT